MEEILITSMMMRRAKELAPKGFHYVDCGTSGGVWGLEPGSVVPCVDGKKRQGNRPAFNSL